jgi:hypothetical protein
MNGHLAR